MPYAVTGNDAPILHRLHDGTVYAFFHIEETTVGIADECSLDLTKLLAADKAGEATGFFTVVYLNSYLETAGAASEVAPVMGRASAWAASTPDEVVPATMSGVNVRLPVKCVALIPSTKVLQLRSSPDALAGKIVTDVVIQLGIIGDDALAAAALLIGALLTEMQEQRTLIPAVIPVVGVADGGEVFSLGHLVSTYYEVRSFRYTPATPHGGTTHRQHRLFDATGGAAADLAWEESAAHAVADGYSTSFTSGPLVKSDATGRICVRYQLTAGGTLDETVTMLLREWKV